MPHQTRTRELIQAEIEQVRRNRALNRGWPEVVAHCDRKLEKLKRELSSVPGGPWDDEETPTMPYREPSEPPPAPRGRPGRK